MSSDSYTTLRRTKTAGCPKLIGARAQGTRFVQPSILLMVRQIDRNPKVAENANIRPFEVKSGRKLLGRDWELGPKYFPWTPNVGSWPDASKRAQQRIAEKSWRWWYSKACSPPTDTAVH